MASSRTPPSESSTGSHGRRSKRSSAATTDTAIAKYLLRSRYLLDNRTASKSETVKAAKTFSNLRKSMKIMSKFWEEVDTLDEETIGSGLSLLKTVPSLTKSTVKDLERTTSFPDSSRIYEFRNSSLWLTPSQVSPREAQGRPRAAVPPPAGICPVRAGRGESRAESGVSMDLPRPAQEDTAARIQAEVPPR